MPPPEPIGSPDTVRIRPTTALALHLVRAAVIFALSARRRIELPIQRFRDRLAPRSIAPSPLLAPIGTRVLAD